MPEDVNSMLGISEGAGSQRGKSDVTGHYLDYLRDHSACKGLRGSIAATFWFNTITCVLAGVGCIILLTAGETNELVKTEAKIGLFIAFFAVNALIVYRQIAMMVVALVDSIVIRNRDADGGFETQSRRNSAGVKTFL